MTMSGNEISLCFKKDKQNNYKNEVLQYLKQKNPKLRLHSSKSVKEIFFL